MLDAHANTKYKLQLEDALNSTVSIHLHGEQGKHPLHCKLGMLYMIIIHC